MDTPEPVSIASTHIKDTSHSKLKLFLVILLAFVASGCIGATLYFWTQNQQQTTAMSNKDLQISTLNAQVINLKKPTPTPTPSTAPVNANVIAIKELGISVTVPDSVKDITYSYTSFSSAASKFESVSLSTKTLTDKYASTKECTSYGIAPPLGGLSKYDGQYDSKNPATNSVLVKQFSKFYVLYSGPQSVCADKQTDVTPELKIFKDSLTSIKLLSL